MTDLERLRRLGHLWEQAAKNEMDAYGRGLSVCAKQLAEVLAQMENDDDGV
jgi:hypothetical protein